MITQAVLSLLLGGVILYAWAERRRSPLVGLLSMLTGVAGMYLVWIPGHASALANVDIRSLLNASSGNGFEQWARHAENFDAEIANRERIEPGALESDVLTRADLHGARFRQIVLKSGKQGLQGLQPAREQHVGMLGLGRAASWRGLRGKRVTLDDRDFSEMP